MHSNEIILWEHEVIVLWGTFTTVVKALYLVANRIDSGSDMATSLQSSRRNRFVRDARCCVLSKTYTVEEHFTLFVTRLIGPECTKRTYVPRLECGGNAVLEVQR